MKKILVVSLEVHICRTFFFHAKHVFTNLRDMQTWRPTPKELLLREAGEAPPHRELGVPWTDPAFLPSDASLGAAVGASWAGRSSGRGPRASSSTKSMPPYTPAASSTAAVSASDWIGRENYKHEAQDS